MLRFVPDGVAHLPVAGVAAQRLRVDALHRVWAIHTPGIQICFIIPVFILPEPDDPPLVRSFFCPAEHGKAVSVDARLQSWEAAIRGTAVSMMTASGLKPYDCPISITGEIRVPRTDKLHDLPAWQTDDRSSDQI